jgi:hypothetical protein
VSLARPAVHDLVFQLYDRPLHPELFEIVACETVARPDFQAQVRITRSGHVVSWSARCGPPLFLTEVVNADEEHFPSRRLLSHPFRQERYAAVEPCLGVRYQACFQVETLPPALFLKVNDELLRESKRHGFIHYFPPAEPFELAPIGYVTMDGKPGCQLVHAYHTFPEECTVVKTQSLFETFS